MELYSGLLLMTLCSHNVLSQSTNPDTTKVALQPCPDIMCTLEFIPDECREITVLTVNGVACSGCPQWKATCRDILPTNVPLTSDTPRIACPLMRCERLTEIPNECREKTYYEFRGQNCTGCPKWRAGCQPPSATLTDTNQQWEISCPLLYCEADIPAECKVKQQFVTKSGRHCSKCPIWREGCREQERIVTNGGLQPIQRPDIPCPYIACPDNRIPTDCKEEQPYDFNGRTCFNCPKWRPGCELQPEVDLLRPNRPEIACPLIRCDLPDLPENCFEKQMFLFQDKMCHKCPRVKTECQTLEQPRPVAVVDPSKTPGTDRIKEIPCPLRACPLIYIPDECREIEKFEFQGKLCPGCPKFKPGCIPFSNAPKATAPSVVPQIPQIPAVEINRCPIFECEWQMIPPECVELPTVVINGKNCTTCPRYRQGCIPSGQSGNPDRSGSIGTEIPLEPLNPGLEERPIMFNEVSCPMVACTRIFIPPECREVVTYNFQGKTCHKCPKWREGCIPGSDTSVKPDVPVATTPGTPADKVACPLMRCNKMYIPPECRVETPYLFMNIKTCYRCPKWREGCTPGEKQVMNDKIGVTDQDKNTTKSTPKSIIDIINNDVIKNQNSQSGSSATSGSLTNLKGVVPVDKLLNLVNQINCPPLPCPTVYIPSHCLQTSHYEYQGKLCDGCPTWRTGCSALDGQWQNSHFDGLLAYNLFRELAGFSL